MPDRNLQEAKRPARPNGFSIGQNGMRIHAAASRWKWQLSHLRLASLQQNSRSRTTSSPKQICKVRRVEYTGCMSLYHSRALYDSRFFVPSPCLSYSGTRSGFSRRIALLVSSLRPKSYETAPSTAWLRYILLRDSTVYLYCQILRGMFYLFVLFLRLVHLLLHHIHLYIFFASALNSLCIG